MALNPFMHPRNIYKSKKPSFKSLASKYPFVEELIEQDEKGKITLDFKQPKVLAALSRALLLEDFNLDVQFPLDRLIPTIPLRLNYILWIEDILAGIRTVNKCAPLILDIGTGSTCIYPIIGAIKNNWNFVGLECDSRNYSHSLMTVQSNKLSDKIHLFRVNDIMASPLLNAIESYAKALNIEQSLVKINVVMANPPFFSDVIDAVGIDTTRSLSRIPAKSVSSAARQECQTPGGEIGFAKRLIDDSLNYKNSIDVFTLMLGKKRSVSVIRAYLHHLGITNTTVYEMCQGRVMRWGIGWSFLHDLEFPISEFRLKRKFHKPPLSFTLPDNVSCLPSYTSKALLEWLLEEFKNLKMQVFVQRNRVFQGGHHLLIDAREDTWTHIRRRRRENLRAQKAATMPVNQNNSSILPTETNLHKNIQNKRIYVENVDESDESVAKRRRFQRLCEEGQAWIEELDSDDPLHLVGNELVLSSSTNQSVLIRAKVFVESEKNGLASFDDDSPDMEESDDHLTVSIELLDGKDRETVNRIICYLKNRLK